MLSGFREFILRGNIVELAVGVVIGVAFNDLVTTFTKGLIQPLIGLVSGGKELSGTIVFHHQHFTWAAVVNAIVNFLIVAAVLYFVVIMPMNKLANMRKRGQIIADAPPPPEDIVLLTQIRDALLAGGGPLPAQRHAEVDDPALDS
jgi:large conductance mechanosensitive channel